MILHTYVHNSVQFVAYIIVPVPTWEKQVELNSSTCQGAAVIDICSCLDGFLFVFSEK